MFQVDAWCIGEPRRDIKPRRFQCDYLLEQYLKYGESTRAQASGNYVLPDKTDESNVETW